MLVRTFAWVLVVVAAPTRIWADVAARDRPVALTVTIPDTPIAREVEAFLCQRAHETFALFCNAPPEHGAWVFDATLTWLTPKRVSVHVQDQAGVLVSRTVEVEDPGAAKLTLWLLLRATMNRALTEPGRVAEPAVSGATEFELQSIAAAPDPEAKLPSQPVSSVFGFSVLAAVLLEDPRLFAIGASFCVYGRLWRGLVLSFDLGYRLAPGVETSKGEVGLVIHHLPIGLSAGWELGSTIRVASGGFVASDVKLPVSAQERAAALGVDTGLFMEIRLPLNLSEAHFLFRGTAALRLVRQRYRVDSGEIAERSWVAGLGAGVGWQ